jgi:hypothetical protein
MTETERISLIANIADGATHRSEDRRNNGIDYYARVQ